MRLVALICGITALTSLSGCAEPDRRGTAPVALPAGLTYAPPGTRITLRNAVNSRANELQITAAGTTGPRGAHIRPDGKAGSFYPGCWRCGGEMRIEEEKFAALWPLEPGKEVTFLRTDPKGDTARVVIRVAGTDRITIPAGQFQTYVLDGRIQTITGPRYSAQVRAWWAPRPGWVVRAEGGDSQGNTLSSVAIEIIEP